MLPHEKSAKNRVTVHDQVLKIFEAHPEFGAMGDDRGDEENKNPNGLSETLKGQPVNGSTQKTNSLARPRTGLLDAVREIEMKSPSAKGYIPRPKSCSKLIDSRRRGSAEDYFADATDEDDDENGYFPSNKKLTKKSPKKKRKLGTLTPPVATIGPVRSNQLKDWQNSFYGNKSECIDENLNSQQTKTNKLLNFSSAESDRPKNRILTDEFIESKINGTATKSKLSSKRFTLKNNNKKNWITENEGTQKENGGGRYSGRVDTIVIHEDPVVPIPRHLVGFKNNGNTCYLNACLQSVIALPCFTSQMLQLKSAIIDLGRRDHGFIKKFPLTKSLIRLIIERESNEKVDPAMVKSLSTIKRELEELSPMFIGNNMQDASECVTILLDTIEEDARKILTSDKLPEELRCSNPVTETFKIERQEISRCLDCAEEKSITQTGNFLICPLSKDCPPSPRPSRTAFSTHPPTSSITRPSTLPSSPAFSAPSLSSPTSSRSTPSVGNSPILDGLAPLATKIESDYKTSVENGLIRPRIGGGGGGIEFFGSPMLRDRSLSPCLKRKLKVKLPKPVPAHMKGFSSSASPESSRKPEIKFGSPRELKLNKPSISEEINQLNKSFSFPEKVDQPSTTTNEKETCGSDPVQLEDLIKQSFKNEEREKRCEKCKGERADISSRISVLPRVLIVFLSRYDKEGKKITWSVKVPRRMDLSSICTPEVKFPTLSQLKDPQEEETKSAEKEDTRPAARIRPFADSYSASLTNISPLVTPSKWDKYVSPQGGSVADPPKPVISSETSLSESFLNPHIAIGASSLPVSLSAQSSPKGTPVKFKGKTTSDIGKMSEEDQIEYLTYQSIKEAGKEDDDLEKAIQESLKFSGKKRPLEDSDQSNRYKSKLSRVEGDAKGCSTWPRTSIRDTQSLSVGLHGDTVFSGRRFSTSSSRKTLFKDADDEKLKEALRLSLDKAESVDADLQRAVELSLQENAAGNTGEHLNKPAEDGGVSYRLCSMICHIGSTATSGHYTAKVFRDDAKGWFHYDDETVTPMLDPPGDRSTMTGYILMYTLHRNA